MALLICWGLVVKRSSQTSLAMIGILRVLAGPQNLLSAPEESGEGGRNSHPMLPCPPTRAVFLWPVQQDLALGCCARTLEPGAAALIHAKEGAQVCPVYL